MAIIAPSILSANFGILDKEVEMLNASQADWLHVDIMDGVFVPNISFGFPVLQAINKVATKPLDVHLMIIEPERYLERFAEMGAASISIHLEASNHIHRAVQMMKDLNVKAGIAINPHTSVFLLKDILPDIDFVNLMSVNPGFGGQKFIENTYIKIKELRQLAKECQTEIEIEIDGGVNLQNAPKLIETGASILVAGNTVFQSSNPQETVAQLKSF